MRPLPGRCELDHGQEREDAHEVLDLLWRKLHGIHEQEVTRTAARLRQAPAETREAVEGLSITILREVFTRCSAALFDPDRDDERQIRARMLAELFDLREEQK